MILICNSTSVPEEREKVRERPKKLMKQQVVKVIFSIRSNYINITNNTAKFATDAESV